LNGEWSEVGPGGTAFMPRGIVHTFNVGQKPCRRLTVTTPSGFEKFFARCAEEFAKSAKPDMSRLNEIGAAHGIHFVQE
jgi:hypothetical protein